MKYIFRDGIIGKLPIKNIQIAHYDMKENGKCFDKYYINPEEFNIYDLMCIETEDNKNDMKKSKVFINNLDGSVYEIKLMKIN